MIGALLPGLLSLWSRGRPEVSARTAMLGLTGVTLYVATQNAGPQNAPADDAIVILGGIPLASSILGITFLRERLGGLQVAGLVCSLAGMVPVGSMLSGGGAHSAVGLAAAVPRERLPGAALAGGCWLWWARCSP